MSLPDRLAGYSAEQLETFFSPAVWHPDRERILQRHADHGVRTAGRLEPLRDVRYGPGPLQTIDVFPGQGDAPVCVIFHGGFWRTSDKRFFLFAAEPLVAAGMACFVVNFDLCPDVPMDEIVRQAGQAMAWVRREARRHGGDPDRLYVLGHATGAHLAAMALRDAPVAGGLLISGLYDLRGVPLLKVNAVLKLDAESASRMSPLLQPLPPTRLIVAVAAHETPEFIAQSRDFAAYVEAAGCLEQFQLIDAGHFDIVDQLGDPQSPMLRAFLRLTGASGPR